MTTTDTSRAVFNDKNYAFEPVSLVQRQEVGPAVLVPVI